ncbi:hypothetical protein [Microbacterium sp. MPKO10]|uniref:hypothetical protein n=1 Tax=Microbacterium sp. MPKO10 TaxID=2989818 RepID=UPI002235A29C|nr:hypothetical protein [Microbacterium sp. MPKO10]MCW4458708.1 hypothetical protein [Microbacterium sp. MPKO10]
MGESALMDATVVRVRRSLLWQGLLIVCVIAIPLLLTLYWLAIPAGAGWWVLAAQVLLMIALLVIGIRYAGMRVTVTASELVTVPFLPGSRSFELADVARAIVLQLRRSGGTDPVTQMFVLDDEGALLLRMRGEFWADDAINSIAARLVTAPVEHMQNTVTLDELQRTNPDMLTWFERRPQRSR